MIDREALKARLTDDVLDKALSASWDFFDHLTNWEPMRTVLLDALLAPEPQAVTTQTPSTVTTDWLWGGHVVHAKPVETWLGDRRICGCRVYETCAVCRPEPQDEHVFDPHKDQETEPAS